MIVVNLNKNLENQKMFVTSWMWISKEESLNIQNVPGLKMKFDTIHVPQDFYNNSSEYFVEDGILRRYWTEEELLSSIYN